MLVLTNQVGSYFLVPLEIVERGRVPAEQTAEVERLMAGAAPSGTGGDDLAGYLLPAVFFIGVGIGYFGTKAALEDSSGITTGQMIQGAVDQARGARGGFPA